MQDKVVGVIGDKPIDGIDGERDTCPAFDTSLADEMMESTSFSENGDKTARQEVNKMLKYFQYPVSVISFVNLIYDMQTNTKLLYESRSENKIIAAKIKRSRDNRHNYESILFTFFTETSLQHILKAVLCNFTMDKHILCYNPQKYYLRLRKMNIVAATKNNNPTTKDAIPALNILLLSSLSANISCPNDTTKRISI
ncbi:unnamed protein product [Mytilus coruscus]|uniref:Uncharacterized protein n=1 Tax=Mytilus coruscus TaxID=42192 RepID=A0A6J8BNX0_MYTCO|nr:unnamed protein product [Mytilus coruscus]